MLTIVYISVRNKPTLHIIFKETYCKLCQSSDNKLIILSRKSNGAEQSWLAGLLQILGMLKTSFFVDFIYLEKS